MPMGCGAKWRSYSSVKPLAGKRAAVVRHLRGLYGKQLKYIRFIIVVSNAENIARYNARRRKPRDIFVWNEKYFDAVEKLSRGINRRALPYILKELGVKDLRVVLDHRKKPERVPALRVEYNLANDRGALYSFFVSARTLADLGYVARLESGDPNAYQRLLNNSRLNGIRKYIEGAGVFKNSVVVNLPKDTTFKGRTQHNAVSSRLRISPRNTAHPLRSSQPMDN
jgi:hypothetical protein